MIVKRAGAKQTTITIARTKTQTPTTKTTTAVGMSRATRNAQTITRHSRIHASGAWETAATGTRLILRVPPEYYWGGPAARTEDILYLLGKCRQNVSQQTRLACTCTLANVPYCRAYTREPHNMLVLALRVHYWCTHAHSRKQQASAQHCCVQWCAGVSECLH